MFPRHIRPTDGAAGAADAANALNSPCPPDGTALPDSRDQADEEDAANLADDHDSPWKDALEIYFEPALRLLAPELHAVIDWSVPPTFLDKELQSISRPGKRGRRTVDKLAGVRLLDGENAELLIHTEIQGRVHGPQSLADIAQRMYEYCYRIRDRMMQQRKDSAPPRIFSLAILTDTVGSWTHLTHTEEVLGCGVRFSCPVVCLGNWADRTDELEALAPSNPFAVFILAQLEANRYPDKRTRLAPKVALMRKLGQYGYGPDEVRQLFRLVDWVMKLPEDLEPVFEQTLQALSQENEMTYVSTIERWGIRKGVDILRSVVPLLL